MDTEAIIDKIVVKPDDVWKDVEVKKVINYKLKTVGIDVVKIDEVKSQSGELILCKVKIGQLS